MVFKLRLSKLILKVNKVQSAKVYSQFEEPFDCYTVLVLGCNISVGISRQLRYYTIAAVHHLNTVFAVEKSSTVYLMELALQWCHFMLPVTPWLSVSLWGHRYRNCFKQYPVLLSAHSRWISTPHHYLYLHLFNQLITCICILKWAVLKQAVGGTYQKVNYLQSSLSFRLMLLSTRV